MDDATRTLLIEYTTYLRGTFGGLRTEAGAASLVDGYIKRIESSNQKVTMPEQKEGDKPGKTKVGSSKKKDKKTKGGEDNESPVELSIPTQWKADPPRLADE